jgi:hypothetical protein
MTNSLEKPVSANLSPSVVPQPCIIIKITGSKYFLNVFKRFIYKTSLTDIYLIPRLWEYSVIYGSFIYIKLIFPMSIQIKHFHANISAQVIIFASV